MRVLGLDCGIASVGWAMLDMHDDAPSGSIIAAGTRMFDSPETDKERRPKSELRRMYRGQRRIIRRRRQRMNSVRRLLHHHGLLATVDNDALRFQGADPWALRGQARTRLLTPYEFAVVLGHIARHRGFKSNAKSRGENAAEDSKMKKAMAATQEKMGGRTFGEMIATDTDYKNRKRNRAGDYALTPQRSDLEAEIRQIFIAQRRLQSEVATPALEAAFTAAAFYQRGLQDSEGLVADCAFETEERRTAKRAPSFELFRYLSRLNTLEIRNGKSTRRLTPEELARAVAAFGKTQKITYKALRKLVKLADGETFATVRPEDEGKQDAVARHGEAAAGTATLRGILGDAVWEALAPTPEKLDRIAEVASFRVDHGNIRKGFEEAGLESPVVERLMTAVAADAFAKFTGAGHISAKACRNIIPHLARGLVYSEAAKACGYDHTASRERNAFNVGVRGKAALAKILSGAVIDRSLVGSPIARKALIEAVKQVKAIVEEYGIPDEIHIELARDVGKSIEERREIENGIERRNKEKAKLREQFAADVGVACASAEDLLRYELWREQNGRCIYSDTPISPVDIVATSNAVQVDHILPWSRFGDDSFNNKTLCKARANQHKRGRTPFEWFSQDKTDEDWETFVARVAALKALRGFKRRNYTIKDAASVEEKFRNRNLTDTRWTSRLLAEVLRQLYPEGEGQRRVFTRPGALTDRLRRAWGLQWIKKDESGKRIADDRHHALDAIITAACTESQLQRLTRAFQEEERKGSPRDFRGFDPPWPDFQAQTLAAVEKVFVSRAERRRARGEAHAATIRSVSERDGEALVFERRAVADLKLSDLDRIKDGERNAAIVQSLRAWIEAGQPKDKPPLSHKGDVIAKVTLMTNKKPEVMVRGGAVDRGEMARVDVFRKRNRKGVWEFYLIPVYPHQIANDELPPMKAVQGGRPESEWTALDATFDFLWSLNQMAYLEIETGKNDLIAGYYRGMDRNTGAITISRHDNPNAIRKGIGARTLKVLNKYSVDRLGRLHLVEREQRTWRGKVCT
jgi:CRISPR-associated endonuclease Csn1